MKTSELIKKLQEVDPSGELPVKIDDYRGFSTLKAASIEAVWNDADRVIISSDIELK